VELMESGSGWSGLLRHLPNIFTSPSEASKKETVSTPSLVTGTSANDCMFKEISKEIVNEIGSCHFDCFEVWRYCGHLLFLCLRCRRLSRYSRPHRCLVAPRAAFGAGTREKNLPNSERRKGYPERSPKNLSFQSLWSAKSARRFCVPVHSPMARVYANVNALSGPKWYDYGP